MYFLGNVIPIHDSIGKYGADVVRLYLTYAADPETTLDWRETQAENTSKRLHQFQDHIERISQMPDEDVEEGARIMEEKQIRRLVLCDDSGAYLGVVSLGDLAYRAHSHELSGEALEKVCEREHA